MLIKDDICFKCGAHMRLIATGNQTKTYKCKCGEVKTVKKKDNK